MSENNYICFICKKDIGDLRLPQKHVRHCHNVSLHEKLFCRQFGLGMYRIVILPDNRIPDILLIETKPDSRIPDILQFFTAGFGYPAGYPAIFYSRIRISGRISG